MGKRPGRSTEGMRKRLDSALRAVRQRDDDDDDDDDEGVEEEESEAPSTPPGQKGTRKRTGKKMAGSERTRKLTRKLEAEYEGALEDDGAKVPSRKSTKKQRKAPQDSSDDGGDRSKKRTLKKTKKRDSSDEDRRRAKKLKKMKGKKRRLPSSSASSASKSSSSPRRRRSGRSRKRSRRSPSDSPSGSSVSSNTMATSVRSLHSWATTQFATVARNAASFDYWMIRGGKVSVRKWIKKGCKAKSRRKLVGKFIRTSSSAGSSLLTMARRNAGIASRSSVTAVRGLQGVRDQLAILKGMHTDGSITQ